jgi:hypothetical protein
VQIQALDEQSSNQTSAGSRNDETRIDETRIDGPGIDASGIDGLGPETETRVELEKCGFVADGGDGARGIVRERRGGAVCGAGAGA